ncbi:LOW QUALITY PROTEIN: hypothetical protein U9M48_038904, partial [Paspalum notatum var. saurae]
SQYHLCPPCPIHTPTTAAAAPRRSSQALLPGRHPIQRLFFFDGPDLPPFPSIISALQVSLSVTLAIFLPLAGKLAFRRSHGDIIIDCSPAAVSAGVEFIEAEFSGSDGDMRRLASDEEQDTETFLQLVPEIDIRQLPAQVLAVQVTRPAQRAATGRGAPVAVGVSILHAAVDGQAVWQFMKAWSMASREGSLSASGLLVTPTFDRGVIRHPKSEELCRTFLRFFAPALPLPPSSSSTGAMTTQQIRRRTFLLSKEQIQSLKRYVAQRQSSSVVNGHAPPPEPTTTTTTTYVAVSSLVWTSMVRAKSLKHTAEAHFMVTADCSRRLDPPPGEGFFGNCVKPCFATANAGDLCSEAGLAHAAAAIQKCIRESLDELADPLSDIAAPSRVELVSMFTREMVTLLAGARDGSVQVSVALDRESMEAYVENFVVPVTH